MVFDGPASSNYDLDLGPYLFNEVYQGLTAWQVNAIAAQNLKNKGGPPGASNIVINGSGVSTSGEGSYNKVTITKGKKYRLRLVNIAVDSYIRVSLDNHNMTVMTSDFVPINPFTTQWLLLAIGQRYDVVINANQASGNYWFRAESQAGCFSSSTGVGRAIWTYADATSGTPSSSAWPEPSGCLEPQMSPYWKQPVPSASFQNTLDTEITNAVVTPGGDSMVVWALNKPIWVDYANPTMQYLMEGNTSYPEAYNVINTNSEGSWNYWLITSDPNTFGLDHPIHLHGHDFFVIGQGSGTYDESSANLNWNNPVRRDTATLPASGWLAIAFASNNPGAWLMVSDNDNFLADIKIILLTYDILNSTATSHGTSARASACSTWSSRTRSISLTRTLSLRLATTTSHTRATRAKMCMACMTRGYRWDKFTSLQTNELSTWNEDTISLYTDTSHSEYMHTLLALNCFDVRCHHALPQIILVVHSVAILVRLSRRKRVAVLPEHVTSRALGLESSSLPCQLDRTSVAEAKFLKNTRLTQRLANLSMVVNPLVAPLLAIGISAPALRVQMVDAEVNIGIRASGVEIAAFAELVRV